MERGKIFVFVSILVFGALTCISGAQTLTPVEELGKAIFFDQKLSARNNQFINSATIHNFGRI